MPKPQTGTEKTKRRKLPASETFCRFSAQTSGGNLLLCFAEIPMPEGNSHERRFTSCTFIGKLNRE
jgi:hypothetical protein